MTIADSSRTIVNSRRTVVERRTAAIDSRIILIHSNPACKKFEKRFQIRVVGRSKRIFFKRAYEKKAVRQARQDGLREWMSLLVAVCLLLSRLWSRPSLPLFLVC
jgi:hypothetical protein